MLSICRYIKAALNTISIKRNNYHAESTLKLY
nr:MAG TPA: hypothetical protein [Caudoviricetes sp.]